MLFVLPKPSVHDGYDVWGDVLGYHGLDVRNQAGEEFLGFCGINQLSLCL